MFLLVSGCGSEPRSNPGANVTGKWNAVMSVNGQNTPLYTFGLDFTMHAATISGSEISYTGGATYNNGCINYGQITASGNTDGASLITLKVTDPSTNSSFTVTGSADPTATQINGTFQTVYGPNGSQPACANTEGTILLNRQ
jgi:hypothetical protein